MYVCNCDRRHEVFPIRKKKLWPVLLLYTYVVRDLYRTFNSWTVKESLSFSENKWMQSGFTFFEATKFFLLSRNTCLLFMIHSKLLLITFIIFHDRKKEGNTNNSTCKRMVQIHPYCMPNPKRLYRKEIKKHDSQKHAGFSWLFCVILSFVNIWLHFY